MSVVFQPGGRVVSLLALPEREVWWSDANYLTLFGRQRSTESADQGRFSAIASLPINNLSPRSIVLTPDGADAIALFSVATSTWEGRIEHPPYTQVVERWNLATRTRRWSRTLPALPEIGMYTSPDNVVMLGPHGLYATRCMIMSVAARDTRCHVDALDERTGALGPTETLSYTDFQFSWRKHRQNLFQQVSAGRRFTLLDATSNGFPHFPIFDDRGRRAGRVIASCARFAEGGSEERPTILIDDQSSLGANASLYGRFNLIKDASACQLQQDSKEASERLNSLSQRHSSFRWLGGGRRIVWSSVTERGLERDELPKEHVLDVDRVGLPGPLPAPPGMERKRLLLSGSGSDLYVQDAQADKRLFHLEETGFVLDSAPPAPGYVLNQRDDVLLAGHYQGLDASKFRLLLGKRQPGKGIAWQRISAVSQFTPDFVSFEDAGRPRILIAGGKAGLQWIDARTGQMLLRSCGGGAEPPGRCSDKSETDYRGLVMSSARKTAFTMHLGLQSTRYNNSFAEIELSTGKILRSFPAPDWDTSAPLDLPMGWVEKERRFWIEGSLMLSERASVTMVTIPEGGAAPRYDSFAALGRYPDFGADPEGRFFMFGRDHDTIDVIAPDGTLVVTLGTRDDGAFAQARDGRFACTGSACDEFRCVVGDVARPATDPACAAFRVAGFSIREELARVRK
ncbi:hypothetical protein WMF37_42550 [Sorangium sp. So ce291]|uniref:hypothetical protein n=1 Tax=Sorangium sp. So ce291 TaxID=3133294 RepID=UPI003F61BC13